MSAAARPVRGGPASLRPDPGRARTVGGGAVWTLAAVLLLLGHAAWFGFVVDDAYISFRYAQNLTAGHGLVFNPGERVEGYSNLLWVLLTALGLQAGWDPLLWTRIMGAGCAAAMLALLPGCARSLLPADRDGAAWAGRAAQLLAAACGPVACWTLAGLETPLWGLLVVAGWRAALERRPAAAGIVGVLLVLCRPEGPAPALWFTAWSLLPAAGRPRARRAWIGPAALAVGTAAFFLWRHAYFGWWLPNTYYAKTGDPAGQLRTGLPYALAFLRTYGPALVLGAAWALALGRRRRREGAGLRAIVRPLDFGLTLATAAAWVVYAALVGGDMLGMFRIPAPILPLLAAGAAALAVGRGAVRGRATALAWTLAVGLALLPGSFWGKERRLVTAHLSEANLGGWILAGDALADILPADATLALGPAGYIPWRTGLVAYDFYGLVDPRIAHKRMTFTHGYAGHEKHDGRLVLQRRPHYVLIGNVDVTSAPRAGLIPPLDREVDIVTDPGFQRDYQQIYVPLAGGRYLNLFQRKDLDAGGQGPIAPAGAGDR